MREPRPGGAGPGEGDPLAVTVVVPVFRGAGTVPALVDALASALEAHYDLEVVLVDDASPDDSAAVCERLANERAFVRFVALAHNVGEHSAVLAGLRHSGGDVVVIMDDDLQHPASEVRVLVTALEGGHDVVYGRYRRKRHGPLRNFGSRFNGWVATRVHGKPAGLYLSSFKAMRRSLVDALCEISDSAPYLDAYILRETRRIAEVPVMHRPRAVGRSGYTYRKLVALFLRQALGATAAARVAGRLGGARGIVVLRTAGFDDASGGRLAAAGEGQSR